MNFASGVAWTMVCVCVAIVGCSDGEDGAGTNAGSGGVSASAGAGETGGSSPSTGGRASNGTGAASFGGLTSSTTGGTRATGGTPATGGAPTTGGSSATGDAGSSGEPSDACDPPPAGDSVYDGDLLVTSDNYAEAQEYTEVTGDLVPGMTEMELPMLRRVGGSIRMTGAASESGNEPEMRLRFPALVEVGGEFYFYLNWGLRALDARSLERVGERVYIHRNKSLSELQLESLVDSGAQPLEITGNIQLPDCYLDTVRNVASNVQKGVLGCTCTRECRAVTAICP